MFSWPTIAGARRLYRCQKKWSAGDRERLRRRFGIDVFDDLGWLVGTGLRRCGVKEIHGLDPVAQSNSNAHSINFDPSNRFAVACDAGTDHLYVYRVDAGWHILVEMLNRSRRQQARLLRHLAFHSRLPYFFITNEKGDQASRPSISMRSRERCSRFTPSRPFLTVTQVPPMLRRIFDFIRTGISSTEATVDMTASPSLKSTIRRDE